MILSQILSSFLMCLLILLSVAFFTLFERKVMAAFHIRTGPNKVSSSGILQPLLDAFKLLTKQPMTPVKSNKLLYNSSPLLSLLLSLLVWSLMPSLYNSLSLNFSLFLFFCLSSFMVLCVLLSGWSSNSKYSLIGSLRSIAQSISYEVVFSTTLVLLMALILGYSISSLKDMSSPLYLMGLPLWLICTLAETHRAPFDFSESESELVSGFNTEYSGLNFAFIFLSEYCILLFSCMLMVLIFLNYMIPFSVFAVSLFTLLVSFFFVWIRITFCRFRYDFLMMMAWKSLLPLSLLLLLIYPPLFLFL